MKILTSIVGAFVIVFVVMGLIGALFPAAGEFLARYRVPMVAFWAFVIFFGGRPAK